MADLTELSEEELEEVSGGAFNFIKAIVYSGTTTAAGGTGTDSGPTATNPQIWIVTAT
jgi:lactobin A/cerein 7B family class IIb bacteriocin